MLKKKYSHQLREKYVLKQKGFVYVMDEIRKRIKSKRGKLNRYNNRVNQYQQKRTFRNNGRMFYKKLNGDSNNDNKNSTPGENESSKFCKKIWSVNEWLSNIKPQLLNSDREEDIIISKKDLNKILKKLPH